MICDSRSCLGPTCQQPAGHHGPHRSHHSIWTDESNQAAARVINSFTDQLDKAI